MKELLIKRKSKFIQYLIATFMFILDHFSQTILFALIFGAIEKKDLQYYKIVAMITIGFIIYSPISYLISRLLRIRYMRDTILDVRKMDAEILFIDEGTSSLNEELGREIENTFLSLGSTVIAISHRYYEGITENYDYVIEIKNGLVNSFPAKDYFEEVITC